VQAAKQAEVEASSGALIDVRGATCTVEDDARRIRTAIQGKEDELNQKLGHLIMYGSSSGAALRLKDFAKPVKRIMNMPTEQSLAYVIEKISAVMKPPGKQADGTQGQLPAGPASQQLGPEAV